VALRIPGPVGSVTDVVFLTERATTRDEVATIFRAEAATERYKDVLAVADDPIVSPDIIKEPHASIIDLSMVRVWMVILSR
jgi:glyceraldehyde 3-phosphate dehydrogenase